MLLNSKKDAHLLRDIRGYTPLMIAAECGHLQSFEALLDHSANHCQVSAQTHKVTGKKGMKQKKKLPRYG